MKTIKKNKYFLTAILLLIFDFLLTWYFVNMVSADLEGNPLFSIDGGFIAIIVNIVYLIMILLIEKLVLNKYETILVSANNSFDYFKKLFKTDRSNFILMSGIFAFVISTLSSRLSAIIDWLVYAKYRGNFHLTKYALLRSKMPMGRFDLVVSLIIFVACMFIFYKIEFNKSQKQINENDV